MADKVLFEVDASKIVAKLHLAGLMAVRNKFGNLGNGFIVNTGIVNDEPNGKPDKLGNISFNLKNPQGKYQVGYVMTISYHKDFDLEKRVNAIEKAVAEKISEKSKLTDKSISDKSKKEKSDEIDAALNNIKQLLPDVDDSVYEGLTGENYRDSLDKLKKAAEEAAQSDIDNYNAAIKKFQDKVYSEVLLPYMQTFAGADNVNMKDSSALRHIPISESVKDSNSNGLISSSFEIEPMEEAEQKKLEAGFRQNLAKDPSPDKLNCTHKMCFCVGYTLNVDK